MSEFSNQLKAQADIGKLIGEYVALRPGGNGYIGLCPFHGEKTPSFHVHTGKQFYYCFGCHAHGDIFQFLVQFKKLAFPEAVEAVAERLGVEVPRAAAGEHDAERQALLKIHTTAADFFESCLRGREGVGARAYMDGRELPAAAAAGFHLGYAPESGRALTLALQAAGFTPELAVRAGLCQLRRESGAEVRGAGWDDLYDRFRDRVMFPIADERGRVIAFGGRALAGDARTPKYLNSPEHPLYTKGRVLYNLNRAKAPIRELGYVILVEGYFDCIRVFTAGFENVVASCGTALTGAQIAPVARMTTKAVINFDPDAAGAAAAERSIGLLLEEGFQIRVVVLADGLDPDLYVRRHGREAYATALKTSRSFFDYLAGRARRQFDVRRPEGKIAALNHLLPYLSQVHDPILRQNLAENCAEQLGVEAALLSQQLLQAVRERRPQLPAGSLKPPPLLVAERVVVRAWAEMEAQRAELAAVIVEEGLLEGLAAAPAFERLLGLEAEGLSWTEMLARLEASDRHLVADCLLMHEPLSPELAGEAVAALRERRRREQVRELQRRLREAAARGDREQVEALSRQKAEWDSRHHTASREPETVRGGLRSAK